MDADSSVVEARAAVVWFQYLEPSDSLASKKDSRIAVFEPTLTQLHLDASESHEVN